MDKSTDIIHISQFCCFHAGCTEGTQVIQSVSDYITQLGCLKDEAPSSNTGVCVHVTNVLNDTTQQNFLLCHYLILCTFTQNDKFVTVV